MTSSLLSVIGSSGAPSQSLAFRSYHPVVAAALFAAILILSMASFHPVLCLVSLVAALVYGGICRGVAAGGKSLLWMLPLVVLIAVLNPLFSPSGSTLIGQIWGRPLYLESLAFGITMGILMCAALVWMQNAAAVITMEDTMMLIGRWAPAVGVMMSMIARFVPRYIDRGQHLSRIAQANTCAPSSALHAPVRAARRFGTLLSWSMEDSLITADAMAARGWNTSARRTQYEHKRWSASDSIALVIIGLLTLAAAVGAWQVAHGFSFYPHMDAVMFHPGIVAFALLMFAPCVLEIIEVARWQ